MITVAARFARLIEAIQPTAKEMSNLTAAQRHLVSYISPRVDTAKFLWMGSYTRGTAIHGSDIDLLQVIRKKELRRGGSLISSNTVLSNLRQHLSGYGRIDVRRDQMALVISYQSGAHIDLVPGYYVGPGTSNYPVYAIPNGSGGWLEASPELHNSYIKAADRKSNGKLKRTVQLLKYWRQCRENHVPLYSFHLEITLASSGICEGIKGYSQCVSEAFAELAGREARSLRDPIGVAGLISASASGPKRESIKNTVNSALGHALRARQAEISGNTLEAVRQWNIAFNGGFA